MKHNSVELKISDHYPIIYNKILFWNIMMQCKERYGGGFNNGFGIIEKDEDYTARLAKVAKMISDIVSKNPDIEVISLCEGPIKPEDVQKFFKALKSTPIMDKFMPKKNDFFKPTGEGHNWGLLLLVNTEYTVVETYYNIPEQCSELNNRLQIWQLTRANEEKYIALAHFPFAGNEKITERDQFSVKGKKYSSLINTLLEQYTHSEFYFCSDFNLNPYLINAWQHRSLDKVPHNNSLLLTAAAIKCKSTSHFVTVDGILLSTEAKQKYHISLPDTGLFKRLATEWHFFHSYLTDTTLDNKQKKESILPLKQVLAHYSKP